WRKERNSATWQKNAKSFNGEALQRKLRGEKVRVARNIAPARTLFTCTASAIRGVFCGANRSPAQSLHPAARLDVPMMGVGEQTKWGFGREGQVIDGG
ncbi:MAG TPA: hypothetical protein VFV87_07560, partial [Pirellulaceae bacterium]|nr:hypothetical protein [Pirellulaceae bacterium]